MKQSRKDLLQQIYDFDQSHGGEFVISTTNITNSEFSELQTDVNYLLNHNYICKTRSQIRAFHLALTEKGEQFVEDGFQSPQSTQSSSFNFAGATINNAVIGNDATNNSFVMNVGTSIADLKELIGNKPVEDQEDLQEMLHELERLQNSDEPIQRNLLTRFSDLIKKHTDLIVPIGQTLIGLCAGTGQ